MRKVFERLQAGDESYLPAFKEMMDAPGVGEKVVDWFGDLAARTREFAVDQVALTNLAIRAATPRKLAKLRAELEGPEPSAIERLLAERVVFCWLMLWEFESALLLRKGDMSFKQAEFYQRRIDASHRRYLSSLRTLATVRKLAVPDTRVDAGPDRHHEAEATAPCSCHDGAELPAFAERFGRIK